MTTPRIPPTPAMPQPTRNAAHVLYISGPITAATTWVVEQNVRKAEQVYCWCCLYGVPAICVHTMGRFVGDLLTHAQWMDIDLALLRRCHAIYMLPGWEKSAGACEELEEAQRLGLKVLYSIDEVCKYYGIARGAAVRAEVGA
jgi:hypothetical protein